MYHRSSQLAAAIVAALADPNFKVRLLTLGVEANPLTSGASDQFIADEIAKWAKVIKLPTSCRSDRGGVPYFPLGEHRRVAPTASGKSLSQMRQSAAAK